MTTHGRPRLVLHIGTHKTGTTSVQHALARARRGLRAQGIIYPDTRAALGGSARVHHAVARALTAVDPGEVAGIEKLVDELLMSTPRQSTVLISAESLYGHVDGTTRWRAATHTGEEYWERRRRYLARLASVFRGFELEVLLVLRRPDRYLESYHAERVTKALAPLPFSQWRERRRVLAEYSAQVALLREVVGPVTVVQYEHAGDVEAVVFHHVGAEPPAQRSRLRTSADARLVLWMQQTRPGNWEQRRAFLASDTAAELFPAGFRTTLWSSLEERQRFLAGLTGPYGHEWFPAPQTNGQVARLDDAEAARISSAWFRWLAASQPRVEGSAAAMAVERTGVGRASLARLRRWRRS